MKRGYQESSSSGSLRPPQSKIRHNPEGDAHFLEDESTKVFARKVADHYSARMNQTLEEQGASPIIHLKKLNNCIKSVLIQLYAYRGDAVLDLACGKVEGQTDEVIFDHLHATAFRYTPLGRTILGPAQNIKTITKYNLQKYISTHYTAPRMHEDIVEQVKKLFTKLSTDPTIASELVAKEPAIFTGSEDDDDIPLAQFAVAFNGASWTDPDSIALVVMQSVLGSWNKNAGGGKHMGSELAQRVGINEIAENMMAFNTNYKDTGLFGVYAIAKPDCLDDLAYAIMYEMSKLCYRVSEADVTRACNQLKSSLLLHMDGTSPVAEDIGCQLLTYGRRIPFVELFARIDAVDSSTVKRVANRFIFDQIRINASPLLIANLPAMREEC
ncbi:hypothetical protein ACSBR1_014048 [Camellia fascicularis]